MLRCVVHIRSYHLLDSIITGGLMVHNAETAIMLLVISSYLLTISGITPPMWQRHVWRACILDHECHLAFLS